MTVCSHTGLLQGFMTAVLQTYARQTMTPIDSLKFRTHVLEKDKDDLMDYAEIGTYIYGLFMEGAKWDKVKKEVAESDPSILYFAMPAIWHALLLTLACVHLASLARCGPCRGLVRSSFWSPQ